MRCLLITILGLQSAGFAAAQPPWPVPDWQRADAPETEDMSSSGLKQYMDWLTAKASGRPFGSVIVRHGKIVCELYGSGATRSSAWDIGSIRKAVGSTVLGMAIRERKISLDQPVCEIWPPILSTSHGDKDKRIRVEHLFSSCSGWKRAEEPGTKWVYNNAAFTASGIVVARACHLPNDELAPLVQKRIADVIGATSWHSYHSPQAFDANYSNPGPKLTIESNVRDLARFGYLWLREGQWRGREVVPTSYVRAATRNQVRDAGGHYGYCWFVNDHKALLPSAPADAFYHVGNGQEGRRTVLLIIPSLDLVAVVGTHASQYDITNGYVSVPVKTVDEWVHNILQALVPAGGTTTREEETLATPHQ